VSADSGAGTKLKRGGGTGTRAPKFFRRAPPLFSSTNTIRRFGERFLDGQYSLISFLIAVLLLTVPPVPGHF